MKNLSTQTKEDDNISLNPSQQRGVGAPQFGLFKISKEIEKMSDTDFISELPDSLLIHILSFMTTRDAMRTRWVAKRWRKLWAFVTVLDLSEFYNDYHHPFYSCVTEEFSGGHSSFLESLSSKQHCCQEFESFVKALLHLRETSQLDTFRFAWECRSPPFSCGPNLDFLLDVLKFRPRVVHFSMDLMVEWRTALDPLFTCVSLEEMVLHVCFKEYKTRGFRIFQDSSLSCGPELIYLPRVKVLHLSFYEVDQGFRDKILSGCPLLEELWLHHCDLSFSEISSDRLKHFALDSYCNFGGTQKPLFGIKTMNLSFLERLELGDLEIRTNFMMGCPLIKKLRLSHCKLFISEISSNTLKHLEILSCCSNKETQVSTRNLIYLGIGIDASGISFKSMPSLMKACINFSYMGSIGLIDGEFRLLSLLSNVTSLDIEVTSDAKIMLMHELQKCPALNNLKTLMLEGYSDEILDLVVCFMHQVPRLDKLSLNIYERSSDSCTEVESTLVSNEVPVQCEHIQLVDIIHGKNQKHIDKLVNALHAHVKTIDNIITRERSEEEWTDD